MERKLHGFLSCILTVNNKNELEVVSNFAEFLTTICQQFEIIVCIKFNSITKSEVEYQCSKTPSLAVYELSTANTDSLFSAGLELALGDWVLELPDVLNLESDTQKLIECFSLDSNNEADSYQLLCRRRPLSDRALSFLAGIALEVPVHTMLYMPRLTKRSALQTWNSRKLRVKVLRIAPQLGRGIVNYHQKTKSNHESSRFFRISLRTLVHSSAKPLRWVSFLSLLGAFLSVIISIVILFIGIRNNVVPGWTTTNLQISMLSFLILLVLGILTEYIYQIAASLIDQPSFRIVQEFLSPRYSFQTLKNISIPTENRLNSEE